MLASVSRCHNLPAVDSPSAAPALTSLTSWLRENHEQSRSTYSDPVGLTAPSSLTRAPMSSAVISFTASRPELRAMAEARGRQRSNPAHGSSQRVVLISAMLASYLS